MDEIAFDILDVSITLKCNAKCKNCLRLCNMSNRTGLDYSNSDMTIGQINNLIAQIKNIGIKPLINILCVTGGEALLRPNIEEITLKIEKELLIPGYIQQLFIGSNSIITPPHSLARFIRCNSTPEQNKEIHNTALLHPKDFGGTIYNYHSCYHYRKKYISLSYHGFSVCCAADAYIRLFAYEDLIIDTLPNSLSGFPLDLMSKVCQHCPFSNDTRDENNKLPFEKDLGSPMSETYISEAILNKAGRGIKKRFGEV